MCLYFILSNSSYISFIGVFRLTVGSVKFVGFNQRSTISINLLETEFHSILRIYQLKIGFKQNFVNKVGM